jgi:hypothetical protein
MEMGKSAEPGGATLTAGLDAMMSEQSMSRWVVFHHRFDGNQAMEQHVRISPHACIFRQMTCRISLVHCSDRNQNSG